MRLAIRTRPAKISRTSNMSTAVVADVHCTINLTTSHAQLFSLLPVPQPNSFPRSAWECRIRRSASLEVIFSGTMKA